MPASLRNIAPVGFKWDEAKAEANYLRHGVLFAVAVRAFSDPDRKTVDAFRQVDGEARERVVGRIEDYIFTVVYTCREETVRVISARRASRDERRFYHGDRPVSI